MEDMNKSQPKVSAVITTYKRHGDILKRSLESVLNQTYENICVWVVDDNRDDEEGRGYSNEVKSVIKELLEKYPAWQDRVHYALTEDGKHGGQSARNTGIHMSDGELVAFLDDDDEWLPDKIKRQVELLVKRPDAGMCFTRGNRINEAYDPPFIDDFHGAGFRKEVDYRELLRGDRIGTTSQAMIRRSAIERCGDFDETLPARQDYEMWIRISQKFPIVGVEEVLFNYYKCSGIEQVTLNWDKCILGHTLIYEKYKSDIDADRASKFNVIFYLAHYYMGKGDRKNMLKYYLYSLFVSPAEFLRKSCQKLELISTARKNRKNRK